MLAPELPRDERPGTVPLVGPGPELTAAERRRYARHLLLAGFGELGQRRLKAGRVLVLGAGGLGSPALLYLAAAGVGTIGVLDDDVVDESNLQRQIIHGSGDVGRAKVESARAAILRVNPLVTVEAIAVRLTAENAREALAGFDLVVDGTDNFPTRYLISDACSLAGIPHVWGSVLGFDAQVSVFWSAPPGALGPAVTYRDVFPEPPQPGAVPSCAEAGVLGMVCGSVGSAMAMETVKLLTGIGTLSFGTIQVLDALAGEWRGVPVAPDPLRRPVATLVDDDGWSVPRCGVPPEPAETVTPAELAALLRERDAGRVDLDVVDVREPYEHLLVAIPGSRSIPLGQLVDGVALDQLAQARPLVLYCRSGVRSAEALRVVLAAGHSARHLRGGILAWIDEVDPSLPRY